MWNYKAADCKSGIIKMQITNKCESLGPKSVTVKETNIKLKQIWNKAKANLSQLIINLGTNSKRHSIIKAKANVKL